MKKIEIEYLINSYNKLLLLDAVDEKERKMLGELLLHLSKELTKFNHIKVKK